MRDRKVLAAIHLRVAAVAYAKEGPPIDFKDTKGIYVNRRLLQAALRYAKESGYARPKV